jgi:NAD(P)-dependent dehydrogenase (short-subunit alcohol dehydrogenase family)
MYTFLRTALQAGCPSSRAWLRSGSTRHCVRCYSQHSSKHALIQGASRGLGLEVVKQLLDIPDYSVVATCRYPDAAEGLHSLQNQHGDRLSIHRMDVTDPASIDACGAAVDQAVPHLNLLFNVAAVLHIPGALLPSHASFQHA